MDGESSPDSLRGLHADSEWLRRLALRLVRDPHAADDAVQDTWVSALKSGERVPHVTRGWLATILRNVVRQRAREARARQAREQQAARSEAVESASESIERAQSLRGLVDALLALDEPYRSTLLLHYQDGLSIAQIAARQSVPATTVTSRLQRGRVELRRRLERRDGHAWATLLLPLVDCESIPTSLTLKLAAQGTTALVVSSLAMKKLLVALSLVLLALVAWRVIVAPVAPTVTRADPVDLKQLAAPSAAASVEEQPALVDERAPANAASLASMPPVGEASLQVRLRWKADGRPAVGVGMRLIEWAAPNALVFQRDGVSDAQGAVLFHDVRPGAVVVALDRADGCQIELAPGEQRTLELGIPPGLTIRGRVVDADGLGISGARIWLSDYGNSSEGSIAARSDASGAFVVEHVAADGRYITAFADGFAPARSWHIEGTIDEQREFVIQLREPGGTLSGVVLGPDDAPVVNACLRVGAENGATSQDEHGHQRTPPPPQLVRTDARGRFEVRGVALGTHGVAVRHNDFAPWSSVVEVVPERVSAVSAKLQRGVAVQGLVLDALGKPIDKAFVGVGGYADFGSSSTSTDATGAFRLPGLSHSPIEICANADERGRATQTLHGQPGDVLTWNPTLALQASVSGVVVDEAGNALAGWPVSAVNLDHVHLYHREATTNALGRFQLDNWPTDATHIVVREPSQKYSLTPPALLVAAEAGRADLRLVVLPAARASASVTGRILAPDGTPARNALVMLMPIPGRMSVTAFSDAANGAFNIGPTNPGRYRLQIEVAAFGRRNLGTLELAVGETHDTGDLSFEAPGFVRVTLKTSDGAPLKSVNASLFEADGYPIASFEIQNGAGRSPPLAPGNVELRVWAGDYSCAPVRVAVQPGFETSVEVALERTTYRIVKLDLPAGTTVPETFDFVLRDARGEICQQAEATPLGGAPTIFIASLRVGAYTLDLKTSDGRSGRASFDVLDLEESAPEIEIRVR